MFIVLQQLGGPHSFRSAMFVRETLVTHACDQIRFFPVVAYGNIALLKECLSHSVIRGYKHRTPSECERPKTSQHLS